MRSAKSRVERSRFDRARAARPSGSADRSIASSTAHRGTGAPAIDHRRQCRTSVRWRHGPNPGGDGAAEHGRRRPRRQRRSRARSARRSRAGRRRRARVPRARGHRLPARGPGAQARLRGRQPCRARQDRRPHGAVRRRCGVRRRRPRPSQRRRHLRPRRGPRHLSQATSSELRRLRRAAHVRTRRRAAAALRDRRRLRRRVDLRGRMEPDWPDRRPGRGRRRARAEPQRLPFLRGSRR